jgi:OOP family OmpA-OmpF porin
MGNKIKIRINRESIKMSMNTYALLILFIIFAFPATTNAQYSKRLKPKKFEWTKNWGINLNTGATSFFGDVSLYDDDYSDKLKKESSVGYGIIISRRINPLFNLELQFLKGKLKGKNSKSKFEADVLEYTFNTTLNFVNLLLPDNNGRFFLYAKMGFGQFRFSSRLTYKDPEKEDRIVDTGVPEFVFLMGAGAYYSISPSFNITAEANGRMTNNDQIDGTKNKSDKDYYSYISVGITYNINNAKHRYRKIKRTPLTRKY